MADQHPGLGPIVGSAATLDDVPRRDGRNSRADRSKAAVLAACRHCMVHGVFQPSVPMVAKRAAVSVRTVFQHFDSVDALHLFAVDHASVRDSILNQVLGDHVYSCSPEAERAIVKAIVLGRPEA